jgi:hypothetical protein
MILKEPILKPAAYLVVFNIGAELLLDEFWGIEVSGPLKFMISAGTLILFVVYARLKPLHFLQPVFDWVAEGMADINELFDWVLVPIVLAIKILFKGISFVLRPVINLFNPQSVIVSQENQVTFDKDRHEKKRKAVKP